MDTFLALWEAYLSQSTGQGTIEGFKAYMESFFTDEDGTGRSLVTLSTVHRAKGLEYPRVFLLEPGLLPHPTAKQGWQREQEENLLYVALTRAKYDPTVPGSGALFFVGGVPARLNIDPVQSSHKSIQAACARLPEAATISLSIGGDPRSSS